MGEFELIERFFRQKVERQATGGLLLGIGDDCALLQPDPGMQLAITSDMLVEGRHFLPDVDPNALGHKALAVNLSDLAAMGARPLAFTLAIALPPERAADAPWLDALGDGMLQLARKHACPLAGGDTTAGPLNLCITAIGQVPAGQALRRSGARAGDDIWVSGSVGDARLALGALRGEWALPEPALAQARARMDRPMPRVVLGLALRGIASSCIDVSDGLLGDLGHILEESGIGAQVELGATRTLLGVVAPLSEDILRAAVLAGGDDYELLFTAAPAMRAAVANAGVLGSTRVTRIGHILAEPGLRVVDEQGMPVDASRWHSFDHFV